MINIRSPREIEQLRNSSKILIETFRLVDDLMEPGIETKEINKEIDRYIRSEGAKPAFNGYRGFPASACISVDDEVVHGIPSSRKLNPGQIVGIDIGVEYKNYFSDAAKTYIIGAISAATQKLIDVTKESLNKGILKAVAGNRLSDISHAIQQYVESAGFSVVRDLVGHGIGRELHEEPQLPNYGKPNRGPRLKEGMVLAIEPMVNIGDYKVIFEKDKWTVRTADGSPSAHFEHTVVVKNGSAEILTFGR
jgi:methionyl aminopeptidase